MGLALLLAVWGMPDPGPPLSDLSRWPDHSTVQDALQLNRDLRRHWEWCAAVDLARAEWYWAACEECRRLYEVYDALDTALTDELGDEQRREALALFRQRVGPEHYYAGTLPPAVPVWRLRWVD